MKTLMLVLCTLMIGSHANATISHVGTTADNCAIGLVLKALKQSGVEVTSFSLSAMSGIDGYEDLNSLSREKMFNSNPVPIYVEGTLGDSKGSVEVSGQLEVIYKPGKFDSLGRPVGSGEKYSCELVRRKKSPKLYFISLKNEKTNQDILNSSSIL